MSSSDDPEPSESGEVGDSRSLDGEIPPDQQEYDDGSDQFAQVPQEFSAKVMVAKPMSMIGGINLDDDESLEMEDESDSDCDPDPAFLINYEAVELFRKRHREYETTEKKRNYLALIRQKSKRQRLLELEAKDKASLTPDEKKAIRLIKREENGLPIDKLINDDMENVVTISSDTPYQKRVDMFLGPYEEGKTCFGCTFGVGYTTIEKDVLDQLGEFVIRCWGNGDAMTAAIMISCFYDEVVRTPHNKNFNGHGRPLPEWDARTVYECLSVHKLINSHLWVLATLRQLTQDQKILQRIKYSYPSSILEQRKVITERDYQLNQSLQKQYLEVIKTQKMLRQLDPKTLYSGGSVGLDFSNAITEIITTKRNVFKGNATNQKQLKLTDMTKVKRGT